MERIGSPKPPGEQDVRATAPTCSWAASRYCRPLRQHLDKWYNYCYTTAMKTAISLPDPLFQAAEQFAHEQGLSRSELFARALQAYLQAHRYHGITDALNQIYAEESSALDPAVAAAQARSLANDEW